MPEKQLTFSFDREDPAPPIDPEANEPSCPDTPDASAATPIEDICGSVRRRVHRIRPPVKAHGGKYYLARQIVPILLSAPGKPSEYLEPCAFGASVFLALPRFEREILGDINPNVVNLWQTLAHDRLAGVLRERLSNVPYDQETFEASKNASRTDPVETAAQFIIRSRFSRGGMGTSFAWSNRSRGGKPGDENSWNTFRQQVLPRIVERARGVEVVQDACWWTVWQSRHAVSRLIYADPPYMHETRTATEAYGPYEMTRRQHYWLVAAVRAHPGPAAISGYRCTDYDRWLRSWRRVDFDMPNHSGQGKAKQRRCESLWVNW